MNFVAGMKYVLSTLVKIPMCLNGLSFFTSGSPSRSIKILNGNSNYIDMRKNQMKLYDSWGISFWVGVLFSLIYLMLTSISVGIIGIFTMIFGSILQIIGFVFSFFLLSFFIALGMKYQSAWNSTLIKVLLVLYYIDFIVSFFGTVGSIFSLFHSFYILNLLNVIQNILSILAILMGIDALSSGTAINNRQNYNNFNQNSFNQSSNICNNTQLFNCPYCGGVVSNGQNPCPHCGQMMNWG